MEFQDAFTRFVNMFSFSCPVELTLPSYVMFFVSIRSVISSALSSPLSVQRNVDISPVSVGIKLHKQERAVYNYNWKITVFV